LLPVAHGSSGASPRAIPPDFVDLITVAVANVNSAPTACAVTSQAFRFSLVFSSSQNRCRSSPVNTTRVPLVSVSAQFCAR
jgi:hypothetical protein